MYKHTGEVKKDRFLTLLTIHVIAYRYINPATGKRGMIVCRKQRAKQGKQS